MLLTHKGYTAWVFEVLFCFLESNTDSLSGQPEKQHRFPAGNGYLFLRLVGNLFWPCFQRLELRNDWKAPVLASNTLSNSIPLSCLMIVKEIASIQSPRQIDTSFAAKFNMILWIIAAMPMQMKSEAPATSHKILFVIPLQKDHGVPESWISIRFFSDPYSRNLLFRVLLYANWQGRHPLRVESRCLRDLD